MPQPSRRTSLIPFSPIRTMFRLADEMERAGGGPGGPPRCQCLVRARGHGSSYVSPQRIALGRLAALRIADAHHEILNLLRRRWR